MMGQAPLAKSIVETLAKAGFIAYFAGGWVRDYLLGHPSDDIDIATNAPPETIQALFPHTVPIGIAFGIILVIIDGHPFEVATFRQDFDYKDGRRPSRVEFTTAVEDAKRRDFTINGMFYDPLEDKILDFIEGKVDLENRLIRAIGNPHERIREDRLRMMRAIRLACRFGFTIESKTADAIRQHATELFPSVAIERIWQELTKGHDFGKLSEMLLQLHQFGLLAAIFPQLKNVSPEELIQRVQPMQNYPKDAPVIVCILCLFPGMSLGEKIDLCKQLKLCKKDFECVTFLHNAANMGDVDRHTWAHFYVSPWSMLSIEVLAAHLPETGRGVFVQAHRERKSVLQPFIERIEQKNPLVTSEDLIALGIRPGKELGLLLKEAEKISINEQCHSKETLLKRLRL